MHELLKKEDKYVDVEEPEKVINNLREGSELEIYEWSQLISENPPTKTS